jgi:hypothetical protein
MAGTWSKRGDQPTILPGGIVSGKQMGKLEMAWVFGQGVL